MKRILNWLVARPALVLLAITFLPAVLKAQASSGGGGGGGWVDEPPESCDGTCQAWLTLGWWAFVFGVFVFTGVPL
jgi:hypothetical protein